MQSEFEMSHSEKQISLRGADLCHYDQISNASLESS